MNWHQLTEVAKQAFNICRGKHNCEFELYDFNSEFNR